MKYLLVSLVIVGALLVSAPCLADIGAGVSIPLTVTVTGGSSGGSGGGGNTGGSNGSFPYVPPDWTSIFPSMNQAVPLAQVDNRPVQTNSVIDSPPVVAQVKQVENIVTATNNLSEQLKVDWPITILIIIGIAILAAIVIIVVGEYRKRSY